MILHRKTERKLSVYYVGPICKCRTKYFINFSAENTYYHFMLLVSSHNLTDFILYKKPNNLKKNNKNKHTKRGGKKQKKKRRPLSRCYKRPKGSGRDSNPWSKIGPWSVLSQYCAANSYSSNLPWAILHRIGSFRKCLLHPISQSIFHYQLQFHFRKVYQCYFHFLKRIHYYWFAGLHWCW